MVKISLVVEAKTATVAAEVRCTTRPTNLLEDGVVGALMIMLPDVCAAFSKNLYTSPDPVAWGRLIVIGTAPAGTIRVRLACLAGSRVVVPVPSVTTRSASVAASFARPAERRDILNSFVS